MGKDRPFDLPLLWFGNEHCRVLHVVLGRLSDRHRADWHEHHCCEYLNPTLQVKHDLMSFQACFLIPLGVAIYVVAGGMRATLLCD
jgi:hypothetical protein